MNLRVVATGLMVACVLGGCQSREPDPLPTVFCYRTLASPDCYADPVATWEHRLIGFHIAGR